MLQSPEEGKGDKETAGATRGVQAAAALPLLLPLSPPSALVGHEAPWDTQTSRGVLALRGEHVGAGT